jgi:sec-independent protein translocase protein TatA
MGIGNPIHLIFIAAVALIVLGPKRLPELARSLGNGMREFRESMSEAVHEGAPVSGTLVPEQAQLVPAPESESVSPTPADAVVVDPAQPVRSGDAPDRRPL